MLLLRVLVWVVALAPLVLAQQTPPGGVQRFALILDGAPLVSEANPGTGFRTFLSSPAAAGRRQAILSAQRSLAAGLRTLGVDVTGSVDTLLNAVFVVATPEEAQTLAGLPGVAGVVPMPELHRTLNQALDLAQASAAWSSLGGSGNAGAGVKIAVLDTGIDEKHPGFQDPSLSIPPGFPKSGNADDATHATNKVIAVRSFVAALAAGGDGTPEFSRPDDLSARDRVGHGTAVAMIAAGVAHESPQGVLSGIAPKAWLGNYKIFGSPGVNDTTTADVVLQALEAAFADGMDIAILAAGNLPALWAPGETGADCGVTAGTPCDPLAAATAAAVANGMTVVVPAGNDGALGASTINTPGSVPSVITVGATTNSRTVAGTVSTPDGAKFAMREGDGPKLTASLTAPLQNVAPVSGSDHACAELPAGSLAGKVALIARGALVNRGNCSFATKVLNAQKAGAVAALIYREPGASSVFAPEGLGNTGIPAALIGADAGALLLAYAGSNPNGTVTLDPKMVSWPGVADAIASFSSRGPGLANGGIKPELVAPGAGIYTATQTYDPNGDLYNPSGYAGVDGTSFAAAMVAGAAALVKQAHPGYSPAQIKSVLTDTAATGLTDSDAAKTSPARLAGAGGGKLDAAAAVKANVTAAPATLSFGVLTGALPSQVLTLTNTGSTAVNLQLTVAARDADGKAVLGVEPAALTLEPGESKPVTVALKGFAPLPGSYEGSVLIAGASVPLHVPFSYLVGNNTPATLVPLTGKDFVSEVGGAVQVTFRAVDRFGVPVPGVAVRFGPTESVHAATPATDNKGIAEAFLFSSGTVGELSFNAQLQGAGGIEFFGRTRKVPSLQNESPVVDAASFQAPAGFAPGSYISIFGDGLSEAQEIVHTPYLPVSLAGVSVSFDVPAAGIHVPGHLSFVSNGQVNVQIPWELLGQSSAVMKITLSNSSSRSLRPGSNRLASYRSQTFVLPLASAAPSFFEFTDTSGQRMAAALDEQYRLVSSANPVGRGRMIQFYLNGLGDVVDGTRPASGAVTPATLPLAETKSKPMVTIGGAAANVAFSGLAPFNAGLYQVNVIVPDGIGTGPQTVTFSIGGAAAKTTTVVVQ